MTITRVAAVLILLSQVILLVLVLEMKGTTAILFSFVGHPLLAAGLALALMRLARRERAARTGDAIDS